MFPLVHEASPVPHAASAPSATTSESSKGIKEMDGGGEVERADSRTNKKAESLDSAQMNVRLHKTVLQKLPRMGQHSKGDL